MDLPQDTSLHIEVNDFLPEYSVLQSLYAWKRTVQELPEPLQRLMLPIVTLLDHRSVTKFVYTPIGRIATIDGERLEEPVQEFICGIHVDANQALDLALWYLHHSSRIRNARSRQRDFDDGFMVAKKRYNGMSREQRKNVDEPVRSISKWRCVCCSQDVRSDRDWCLNSECPSWTLSHLATGEHVLREVRSESA